MTLPKKCYHCKGFVAPGALPYFWETHRGYERPHCSASCKAATQAKKETDQARRVRIPDLTVTGQ